MFDGLFRGSLILARKLAASAEGMTLDDIVSAMNVSRSTAERMRRVLHEIFPQMEEIREGSSKRFRIPGGLDGFFRSPTADELLAMNKAADQLRRKGMTADADALASLENKIKGAMRTQVLRKVAPDLEAMVRTELIAVQAGPRPNKDDVMLAVLRQALVAMKALRFTYRSPSKPPSTREVEPYGIIFGRMNYLVAPECGTTHIKTWRLDRLNNLEILERPAAQPEDFSLAAYASRSFGFYHAEPEEVVLLFPSDALDDDFANWCFHPHQTIEKQADGSAIVRFRASGMRELAWHLFSWGNKVQIMGPPSLRDEMLFELRRASTHHETIPVATS